MRFNDRPQLANQHGETRQTTIINFFITNQHSETIKMHYPFDSQFYLTVQDRFLWVNSH